MWWRTAVFYEVYIRSFQDSNADGVGDLKGIIARLDYLADVGIDAIWVTPFYPSPQVDFGYDITDHDAVDPLFGTLDDFDRLVAAAHRRGIRVVIDVVLNHTSNLHPFFVASRAARDSEYRDWYVWRNGRSPGEPPNNWQSAFGGPAWTYDEATDQWYYHCFYPQQPDLNWRNPAVEERLLATIKFWLDHDVDGFRLDAINTLFEDPALRDNPDLPEPRLTLTGVVTQRSTYTRGLPEVHDMLRRLRRFVDRHRPGTLLISEAYVETVAEMVRFYGEDDEVHLPFNFFLAQVPRFDACDFRQAVDAAEHGCGPRWPSLVLSNHDVDRACDRYGRDRFVDDVARVLAAMLLTLRGTPFIYYGEEIAMRTHPPDDLRDVRDPVGRRLWPRYKGRDGVRRPMQWNPSAHAGFTAGRPWLALAPDATRRNVEQQDAAPGSVLRFYRALLQLRRETAALREGTYRPLAAPPDVFAYERTAGRDRVLIVLNMSERQAAAGLECADGDEATVARLLLGTHRTAGESIHLATLLLHPFEVLVSATRTTPG
jgi:alpha-glucosidase